MHIVFLVEELSMEVALKNIAPKILKENASYNIHPYTCKQDLLENLESKLRGYKHWHTSDLKIVVLVDKDQQDCHTLKSELEEKANRVSFGTKSSPKRSEYQVINRIVIEELEAWFFGDIDALRVEYQRIPITLSAKAKYRNPDAISGGTWETMEKLMNDNGYFRGGLRKTELAKNVSKHMDPTINRSRSFQVFRDGLLELINN